MQSGDELHFERMVSSENGYDKLIFYVNGTQFDAISGEAAWQEYVFIAETDATYHFQWRYSKDISNSTGSDSGYIDNVYVKPINQTAYDTGDVNGDGVITSGDALLAIRQALGLIELTPVEFTAADYNADGLITSFDALGILRVAMQLGG